MWRDTLQCSYSTPWIATGFWRAHAPATPRRGGREKGATGVFGGGGVAATPLLHTQNCGMSRGRGVATPWSATGGGGVASAPLRLVPAIFPHCMAFGEKKGGLVLVYVLGETSTSGPFLVKNLKLSPIVSLK